MKKIMDFIKSRVGISILLLLIIICIAISYLYSTKDRKSFALPSPQTIPGIYVPEDILVTASSTTDLSSNEMVLYPFDEESSHKEPKNARSSASFSALSCDQGVTWEILSTDILVLSCDGSNGLTFNVKRTSSGVYFVEEKTGRVWRREPDYSFEYSEGEKRRRLTIYGVPECQVRTCVGEIQGVFEEKNSNGNFSIVAVATTSPNGGFSYGRLELGSLYTPRYVDIGVGKKALLSSWSNLSQGMDVSGEWLLEYDNLKLSTPSSFVLNENNEGDCGPAAYLGPCWGSVGTTTIDTSNVSNDGYYSIVVERSGTEFDYDKKKLTKVAPRTRYQFKDGLYEQQ